MTSLSCSYSNNEKSVKEACLAMSFLISCYNKNSDKEACLVISSLISYQHEKSDKEAGLIISSLISFSIIRKVTERLA